MNAEREVQFHAALLELGSLNCAPWLGFTPEGEPQAWRHRQNREAFYAHKQQLLRWLAWNSIVTVYDKYPDPVPAPAAAHGVIEITSRECNVWIGEFYQWLFKMQGDAGALS